MTSARTQCAARSLACFVLVLTGGCVCAAPAEEDAGVDGGGADASTDAGDAGGGCTCPPPSHCRQGQLPGCTNECSSCSSDAGCPDDGICEIPFEGIDVGGCVYPQPVCGSGPPPATVHLVLGSLGCVEQPDAKVCRWHHHLELDGGELGVWFDGELYDGGPTYRDAGVLTLPSTLREQWAATGTEGVWCTARPLDQELCGHHTRGVQVDVWAPDASHGFEYGYGDGRRPPRAIYEATQATLRLTRAVRWDAGS